MLRFTLASRITLIVLLSLMAVWVMSIAAFYRSRSGDVDSGPPPARIAAIVDLIEKAAPADRDLVLLALRTPALQAEISDAPVASAGRPVRKQLRAPYALVLGDRAFEMFSQPVSALERWFPRLVPDVPNGLEFRVNLHTGKTLVVDTKNPLIVNRLGFPVGFGAGLLGTLVAVAALLIMQRETRPLARLAAAVDRLDLASDQVRLPDARRSAPEIRAVIAAFGRLQDRLGAMIRTRLVLVGGISHDVRTFATRLRLRVDAIPDAAERERAITDLDDMVRLLDDALLSSRVGSGELTQEMIEFARLVRSEVEDRRAQGDAVDLTCDPAATDAIVLGDRVALRRIVGNLADNALKYGGAAHLAVGLDSDRLRLIVDDDGQGIPAGQRAAMLEPFSRLETSRNRKTGGAGLGLAVVRALAEAHDGTVEITEAPSGGARIIIALPAFRTS